MFFSFSQSVNSTVFLGLRCSFKHCPTLVAVSWHSHNIHKGTQWCVVRKLSLWKELGSAGCPWTVEGKGLNTRLACSDCLRLWWDSAVFVAVVSNKEHSPLQQQPVAALSSLFHISVCDWVFLWLTNHLTPLHERMENKLLRFQLMKGKKGNVNFTLTLVSPSTKSLTALHAGRNWSAERVCGECVLSIEQLMDWHKTWFGFCLPEWEFNQICITYTCRTKT